MPLALARNPAVAARPARLRGRGMIAPAVSGKVLNEQLLKIPRRNAEGGITGRAGPLVTSCRARRHS